MLNPFYRQPPPTCIILIFTRKFWAAPLYDTKKIWTFVDKGFIQCIILIKKKGQKWANLMTVWIEWKERWHKQEWKNKFCAEHKLNWENALIISIGKGLFAGPNKVLVNTLQDVC